jgi:hypothetical protein
MSIAPISNISALSNSQTLQNKTTSANTSKAAEQATDTVQLSPAALSHLGGDADHDGDSH